MPPDDGRQMALTAELNAYYDAVTAAVLQCRVVFILSRQAKDEFRNRRKNKLSGLLPLSRSRGQGVRPAVATKGA